MNSFHPSPDDLHVWQSGGAASAEALTAWVDGRLPANSGGTPRELAGS